MRCFKWHLPKTVPAVPDCLPRTIQGLKAGTTIAKRNTLWRDRRPHHIAPEACKKDQEYIGIDFCLCCSSELKEVQDLQCRPLTFVAVEGLKDFRRFAFQRQPAELLHAWTQMSKVRF